MFDAQKEIVYWFTFGKKTPSLFFCFGSADFVYMAATQRQLLNDDLLLFFFFFIHTHSLHKNSTSNVCEIPFLQSFR